MDDLGASPTSRAAPEGPAQRPASGEQHVIAYRGQQAVVTEVGATLRTYAVDGGEMIDGFALDERASGARGQVLAPWPNRLGDGRYAFGGHECQAPLDEPERGNAIHGLLRWLPWRLESRSESRVVMGGTLFPQPGYEWELLLLVEYRLGVDGLTVTARATNLGAATAPFGLGFHPYLTAGRPFVDDCWLQLPARRHLLADGRGLPVGEASVDGTELDYTAGRTIGAAVLDTAFGDLVRDAEGKAWAHLRDLAGGRGVSLWVDDRFRYLMVYTGDTVHPAERRRRSIAIEPMTCPPDVLRSGTDLVTLEPGSQWEGRWGLRSSS